MADNKFSSWNVLELQAYLKERAVSHSKTKKNELIELCCLASANKLELDPNCFLDDIAQNIRDKLIISGISIANPETLDGTGDISLLPNIDHFDIYNYLIQFKDQYFHKQLKAFKSLDGYQLYNAGYVEKVELVTDVGIENYCVIKFLVKPKQRKEDPINKTPFYKGWIILDSSEPRIHNAYCACKGGADGGCRHTVTVLFEIAEYANESTTSSITSGPCLWKKKERRCTDIPVPVDELPTTLPGSSRSEPPTIDFYDPCPGLQPDVNNFYEGLKILKPNACMLLIDIR